jgi:hypothetical protein
VAPPRPRMGGGRWAGPEGVEPSGRGRAHGEEEDKRMEEDIEEVVKRRNKKAHEKEKGDRSRGRLNIRPITP